MRIQTIVVAACLTVVAACVNHPPEVVQTGKATCDVGNIDNGVLTPSPPEDLLKSNFLKLNWGVPPDLAIRRLQGRSLVRLHLDETGKFESAWLLQTDAPPAVASAMCDFIRRLKWETPDSQTLVFAIRICIENCSKVPVLPGFERTEFAITGSRIYR